ncbi:MAG: hypothetical protein WA718_19290 [Terriglobales bacterium]
MDSTRPHAGAKREFSSAFLLASAGFWVFGGTYCYLWGGNSLLAGLSMIFLAILLSIAAIARCSPEAAMAPPVPSPSRRMWLILASLILVHVAAAILITRTWVPVIDTYTFQRDSCKNLIHGIDPFGTTEADIFGPGSRFYTPGMVVNGRVQVGFQYPPITLFWALPGYLLGDVRYPYISAVAISAFLLFAIYPSPRSLWISALLLFNPLTFFVEEKCWTEPLVLLTLSATVYAAVKKRWWLPIALGLFLASKQYNVIALPFVACLIHPFRWRAYWRLVGWALLVATATILPFALWNARSLWHDLVLFHMSQPFRTDAMSFAVPFPLFRKVGPLILAVFVAWSALTCRRNAAMFAAGYGASILLFFSTSKQAFSNYYFLIGESFLLAVVALPGLRIWPVAQTNAQRDALRGTSAEQVEATTA